MKTILCVLAVVASVATAFSQGTVVFDNRVFGVVVSPIYGANPANPFLSQAGNGPTNTPAGTTDWSGFPLLDGSQGTYTAQLWAAPGADQPESSLAPVPTTTTLRSGLAAGFLQDKAVGVPGVLGLTGDPPVTFLVRVWDNAGGTITGYADATYRGESPIFTVYQILGAGGHLPPSLVGLVSFNLAYVPEPATWTLVALGAGLLVLCRWRHSALGS